eukprot:COSAG01_NODE_1594_length_9789_cov_98.477399_8_plen_77_part_00
MVATVRRRPTECGAATEACLRQSVSDRQRWINILSEAKTYYETKLDRAHTAFTAGIDDTIDTLRAQLQKVNASAAS